MSLSHSAWGNEHSASENKAVIKTHKKHFFVIICFAKN